MNCEKTIRHISRTPHSSSTPPASDQYHSPMSTEGPAVSSGAVNLICVVLKTSPWLQATTASHNGSVRGREIPMHEAVLNSCLLKWRENLDDCEQV